MSRRTPLYDAHTSLGGKMIEYAGWSLPAQYTSVAEEHEAVRTSAGIFDVSHMGEIRVAGKDALAFSDRLLTNRIENSEDGQCIYTCMLREDGGVLDDLIVYRRDAENFLWVVNAANTKKDYEWMIAHKGSYDVQVENLSESYALIALQGPKAQQVLNALASRDMGDLERFRFWEGVIVADVEALVSRTGYTGEEGYELYVAADEAARLWEELMKTGEVVPCGLAARDTLRFEAGLPLYGNEMDESVNPLEAGLSFCVKLDKPDFIGRDALLHYRESNRKRKLVGLELIGKGIARHGFPVYLDGRPIGKVTTGTLIPGMERPVAVALIEAEAGATGNTVEIGIRKRMAEAVIVNKKFLKS